jgi:hypothetical protein
MRYAALNIERKKPSTEQKKLNPCQKLYLVTNNTSVAIIDAIITHTVL